MSAEAENDWCMRVVDRMDRFFTKLFGDLGDEIERNFLREGWQTLATLEGVKPMFSTLHWPKTGMLHARARFVGGLLGHTVAHYEAMCDPRIWDLVCRGINKLTDLKFTEDDVAFEPLGPDDNPFVEAELQFHSAMATAMRYPSRQPKTEQVNFFEGYTRALRRGSITIDLRGVGESTRTPAYQLVAAFGPILHLHCNSVHDVHRFLEAMMGKQRAGTIKRTESLCTSINLRFRPSGRPKKTVLD